MTRLTLIAALLLVASPALAHPGHQHTSGFITGLLHPITGADHVLAMVAVGLWAGMLGGQRQFLWPCLFVGGMLGGAGLGMSGVALPAIEPLIALSVVMLGGAIVLAWRAPVAVGAALIGLSGLAHGWAHGMEAPADGSGLAYVFGFALATALLHAAGVGLAGSLAGRAATLGLRAAGGAIAAAGLALTIGI